MKSYCTQNNGECSTCGLVNYGLDCENNHIEDPVLSLAERIYSEVTGTDNVKDREEINEIYDWLVDGDQNYDDFKSLVKEWRELSEA